MKNHDFRPLLTHSKSTKLISMRKLTATVSLTLAVLLGVTGCQTTSFKRGLTAYKSGDYATALREWKPLARQGDANAQNKLGYMHHRGFGVPKDYKTAVKWYRLAAEQGHLTS